MAGFHRCRRRCGIQRWRSGNHRTQDGDYFLDGCSDILEKVGIFNSVWRIVKRLILAGQSAPPSAQSWGF
jgi:hypothetical protein